MTAAPQSDPNDALMQQVAQGDEQAFRQLVGLWRRRVMAFCFQLLRHHQDAEDAAQDVFRKVYQSAASYQSQSSFSSWILRIAKNHCMNLLKKKGTTLEIPYMCEEDAWLHQISNTEQSALDTVLQLQIRVWFQSVLSEIPEQDVQLLQSYLMENQTLQQIATKTNMSVSGVHNRIQRICHVLRQRAQK